MKRIYHTIVKCKYCKRTKSVTVVSEGGDTVTIRSMRVPHSECACLVAQLREALAVREVTAVQEVPVCV